MRSSAPMPAKRGTRTSLDLLGKEFSPPTVAGKKVLIVGVGGGCDIISAYAAAEWLRPSQPQMLVYANTKRRVSEALEPVAPQLHRLPTPASRRPFKGDAHGSVQIDQLVPRGDCGCPLILTLSDQPSGQDELIRSLREFADWDLVISVDTGADSIVERAASGSGGRDKVMLRLLPRLERPWLHVVVAPGCDGETGFPDLRDAFRRLKQAGRYLGCLPLGPWLPVFERFSAHLPPNRTPNIILAAFANRLETNKDRTHLMVPRGLRPLIPASWLTRAFGFRMGCRPAPTSALTPSS